MSDRTCSSKSYGVSTSPKMAAGKKRVLSDKASIRRITSTDYDLAKKNGVLSERSCTDYAGSKSYRISRLPIMGDTCVASSFVEVANVGQIVSERSCSAKADSESYRMSRLPQMSHRCVASSSVEVENVERILSDDSHSIPNRRHIEHPYNVEGKRREAMKSYPTSTPTTPPTMNNATAKAPGRHNAWQHIIQANNLRELPQAEMIFNSVRMTRAVAWALSHSGATSHFLMNGAAAVNIKPTNHPITITLPNGKTIRSTHTCNMDIPWLPGHMTEAHIVPGLAHASLISTRKFCDAGCKVMFDDKECRVYFKGELVLVGGRDKATGLWQLPINPTRKANQKSNMIDHLDLQLLATKMQHG